MRRFGKYLLAAVVGYLFGWLYATKQDEKMKIKDPRYVTDPAVRDTWAILSAGLAVILLACWPLARLATRFMNRHRRLTAITVSVIGLGSTWLKFTRLMDSASEEHRLMSTSGMHESPSLKRAATRPQPVTRQIGIAR